MYAVNIIIYRGKVYLPVQGKFESGVWVDLEPVFESKLHSDEMYVAIEKVISAGHPILPSPTQTEWQKRESPVLLATKAKNWKALAKNGASYSVRGTDNEIIVYMSCTDKQGRWQTDSNKTVTFPKDTPLEVITKTIIDDAQTRPEIFE